ncbi:response regulator [Zavarzinella formosa]|uniref:response regulator n=1 Tax=Zavarzinella formosa TaxID=360055 RepID=UPI000316251C|nr:response regulator [Zavarzinella formosa]
MSNAESAVSPAADRRPCRILCVDDNQDIADTSVSLFKAYGFDARPCYDGHSAVRLAKDFQPDLCFLDLNMPGMEGDELAVHLREQAGTRPMTLIALTAMSSLGYVLRTEAAGFSQYLVKPADPEELVNIARNTVV